MKIKPYDIPVGKKIRFNGYYIFKDWEKEYYVLVYDCSTGLDKVIHALPFTTLKDAKVYILSGCGFYD